MKYIAPLLLFLVASLAFAKKSSIKYWTSFGNCPSRSAGSLVLKLTNTFEESKSLLSLKESIVNDGLMAKYYLSDYKIDYNPVLKRLEFRLNCPEPLLKVQVYKGHEGKSYEALLVSNSELFDPTYEVLLRAEKKLKSELPVLAIQEELLNEKTNEIVTDLIRPLPRDFKRKISEIIIDEDKEMTIILSIKGKPSSVFMGDEYWTEKIKKLRKIISYMSKKKKIPAIINLTNLKKVVVKFNDKL